MREGKELKSAPVEAVLLTAKELECSDLVAAVRQQQKQSRCKWKDFAVLYRQHSHRDDLVEELAEQGVPFTIENMDVMDTAEAQDLFACLGAVVSARDDASLFRVAALPQFAIDPEKLRNGIKSIPRQQKDSGVGSVLAQIDGGPAVLAALQKVRDEITQTTAKSLAALNIIIRSFGFDRSSPLAGLHPRFCKTNGSKNPPPRRAQWENCSNIWNIFRKPTARSPLPLDRR